jgi:hypothetical protein
MGAFTDHTILKAEQLGSTKRVIMTAKGPASYDSGGSTLDLSDTITALGGTLKFTKVYGLGLIAVSAHASSKYGVRYVPAAANAPATGKVKLDDLIQATPAEFTGDASGTTFTFEVIGD